MGTCKMSEEGKSWLLNQDSSFTYKELTSMYNKKFGTNLTWYAIRSFYVRHTDISRSATNGRFKKGHESYSVKPIGSERVVGNKIWVKVHDDKPEKYKTKIELYRYQWCLKHRLVWERANGPINDDSLIIFLDRDPMNCELENLYMVSRRVNAIMNKNRWYDIQDQDTFKTALRCAELISIVKKAK